MKRILMATTALLMLYLTACGQSEAQALEQRQFEVSPLAETVATTCATTTQTTAQTTTTATTTFTTAASAAAENTTTAVEITTEPESFQLTDEKVADKIYDFFSERGYSTAQIAGIIGNAEVESGLEPSRGVPGGGFGLFQLMPCEQRSAMIAEMDARGVGKYATSNYWELGASNFDSESDMDTFLEVMLEYTMNPDDPTWYQELYNTESCEEAAEIFLVHYERAVNGGSPIEYYSPYAGRYYQATESRRASARQWYDYLQNR